MSTSILKQPITELNVSPEFLRMAQANSFETLQDILDRPLYRFHALPESGYRMLREFMNLLDNYGLMHLAGR
jgi:hypothetical protein